MTPEYSANDQEKFLVSIGYTTKYSSDFLVEEKKHNGPTRSVYKGEFSLTDPSGGVTLVHADRHAYTIDQAFRKEAVVAFSQMMRDNVLLAREAAAKKAGVSRIVGEAAGEIDVKRLFLPGVFYKGECPACKAEVTRNYGKEDYLSYPVAGENFVETIYCRECDHEFCETLRLDVTLSVVELDGE